MNALPLVADIELFTLIFARLTAMFLLLPIFSFAVIPLQYRVGLSFFITILIFPIMKPLFVVPELTNYMQLVFLMAQEAGIGIMVAFFTKFLFAAVSLAGELVDMQVGLSMLQMPNPMDEMDMASVTAYFYVLIFAIAFIMLDGHYFLLLAIHKCFSLMPPGQAVLDVNDIVPMTMKMIQNLMEMAIRIGAPIIITMILTTFALGIIAKTMPQMNVFIVGLPLKIGVGFVLMIATLPIMLQFFAAMVREMYRDIWSLLLRMAGT